MARISTHVLDTAKGLPAAGIAVELYFGGHLLRSLQTNADGRTDEPLLSDERIVAGPYEIVFYVEEYLRAQGNPEPQFFDQINIRFLVSEPKANYHVPLLLAPHGYSTYRGS